MTLHLPATSNPTKPLCGRVLSRNAPLSFRDQRTMQTQPPKAAEGFAPFAVKRPKLCRHCQRLAGLIPPLTHSRRYDSTAEDMKLSDDELLEALLEQEEGEDE